MEILLKNGNLAKNGNLINEVEIWLKTG